MDWHTVTEQLLDMLPPPGSVGVSRYTWDLANSIKDGLVERRGKIPNTLYASQNGEIIFEFNRAETVLVRVRVNSTEIIVWLVSGGSLKLKTEFVAPFEVLEQLLKGIIEWLHNLLRLNFTEMLRAKESSDGE